MDADFVLTRAPDLVALGVRFRDFTPAPPAPVPSLVAGPNARVVLWFPPQHVLEQVLDSGLTVVSGWLAQPSRVAFAVPSGTVVALDAAGVLRACATLAPSSATPGAVDTAVEMPTDLLFSPSHGSGVAAAHAATEVFGPRGAVGTWLTRLHAADGDLTLELTHATAGAVGLIDPPGVSLPLDAAQRQLIRFATPAPHASRLQLSALGGSLTARGDFDGINWRHRAAVGRDQEVTLVERGVLYPLGLRAVLTTVSVRDPSGEVNAAEFADPTDSTDLSGGVGAVPAGGALGLRRTVRLRLIDTERSNGTVPLGLTFPFTSVEISSAEFSGLGNPEYGPDFARPTPDTSALKQQEQDLAAQVAEKEAAWRPYAAGRTRSLADLARAGVAAAIDEQDAEAALPDAGADLAALEDADAQRQAAEEAVQRAQAALDQYESSHPIPPPDVPDDELAALQQAVTDAQFQAEQFPPVSGAALQRARDAIAALNRRIQDDAAALSSQLAEPRTIDDVIADPDTPPDVVTAANDWFGLADQLQTVKTQLANLEAQAAQHFKLFLWPRTADGQRLRFPMRLHQAGRAIDTTMPLIFVKDFALGADGDIAEYHSLDDPDLPNALELAWRGSDLVAEAEQTNARRRRGIHFESVEEDDEPQLLLVLPPGAGSGPTLSNAAPAGVIALPGKIVDVVNAEVSQASDLNVVHGLHILGGDPLTSSGAALFTPTLGRAATPTLPAVWAMSVDVPSVRTLLGPDAPSLDDLGAPHGLSGVPVSYARDFLANGSEAKTLFDLGTELGVDFTKHADRSGGLAGMQLAASAISRELGPVQKDLIPTDPKTLIGDAATLLGFSLQDLIGSVSGAPKISADLKDGRPVVDMAWTGVHLTDKFAFIAHYGEHTDRTSQLDLTVHSEATTVHTSGTVTNFTLVFPPSGGSEPLLYLDIAQLKYEQVTADGVAQPPHVSVDGLDVRLGGPLQLLQTLQSFAKLAGGSGIRVVPRPTGVTASLEVPIPTAACGVFSLSGIVFTVVVDIPFTGDPVSLEVAFASRKNPFAVGVLAFGGTGYVDIRIDAHGPRIEASLDFGARMGVDFLVAKGEVHALGGARYVQQGSNVQLTAYLRIGGSLDVLGLVSASIELVIELTYTSDQSLSGRATLVLELDLTLWSGKVEIDSGIWTLQGGGPPHEPHAAVAGAVAPQAVEDAFRDLDVEPTADELAAWTAYRSRFEVSA